MLIVSIFSIILTALVAKSYQQCKELQQPEHGKIRFDAQLRYFQVECDPEYIAHGRSIVYCRKGVWENPEPKCIKHVCEDLNNPENGLLECDIKPLYPGKSCRFSCSTGYQLQGDTSRLCKFNLEWSGSSPVCVLSSAQEFRNDIHIEGIYTSPRQGHSDYKIPPRYGKPLSEDPQDNPCKHLGGCQQICKNDEGRARCRCRSGFTLGNDQKSCIEDSSPHSDIDNSEDSSKTGIQTLHLVKNNVDSSDLTSDNLCYNHTCEQLCEVKTGNCRCNRGFKLNPDQRTCRINKPCNVNNGGCSHKCTEGENKTVICSCYGTYTLDTDGKTCIRKVLAKPVAKTPAKPIVRSIITESCSVNNGGCHHDCSATEWGIVECACRQGYVLHSDGKHCMDIDECTDQNFNHCKHGCINTEGGYICTCRPGYLKIGDYDCEDIDECADESLNRCHHNCVNTKGGYICTCRLGYKRIADYLCEDIDECSDESLNRCKHDCINTEGGFTCTCWPGYLKIGDYDCQGCKKNSYWSDDLQACEKCPNHSHTDSEGKMTFEDCVCDTGYTGNPGKYKECEDIDECSFDNFGCSDICVNIPGSAYCICSPGFMLDIDNKTCKDIDECSIKNGGCEGQCHNTQGSFKCTCPAGFTRSNKDHYSCDDIDECAEDNGGCEQLCTNFRGGYYCACETGYLLDNNLKNCLGMQCPSLAPPLYSNMQCKKDKTALADMANYPDGTTCTFNCNRGFKNTKHSNKMKCLKNGTWAGTLPECIPQHCPPLRIPENGDVHPPNCAKYGAIVKRKCTFTCHIGYKLEEGNPVFVCSNNLTWNNEDIPVCNPVKIQPVIECPEDIQVTLSPGMATSNVTVPEPTTNMKQYEVSPTWVSVNEPVEFPVGDTRVTFTVTSEISNKTAKCVTTVTVLDKEPPVFHSCPDPIKIEGASSAGELVMWEEPVVTDNVEVVSIFSILKPNTTLTPGTHFVEYVAQDASGNIVTCSFDISVIRMNCSDLADPDHGQANCMEWMFGKLCNPQCDDGYIRGKDEPLYYSCDDTGLWEPGDVISGCLQFFPANSSTCLEGFEFKIDDESGDEICVECPPNSAWSTDTRNCERIPL